MQQAVGRVCLVVLVCELRNHSSTVERLSAVLDVHDWDGPADLPYLGLRNAVSHASGLEVVAPLEEGSALSAHLSEHGEGVYALVFGVRSLEESIARAHGEGVGLAGHVDGLPELGILDSLHLNSGGPVYPSYPRRFAVHRQAILQPFTAIQMILGQLEPIG
jgi:hypothetical protein